MSSSGSGSASDSGGAHGRGLAAAATGVSGAADFTHGVSVRFVRSVSFAAAHRYASSAMSEEENRRTYGSLYREEGFGHNFLVEAHFEGEIEPLTGMIINLVDIDAWLKSVASRFDHKHLNEVPELAGGAPTLERLAMKFYDLVAVRVVEHVASLRAVGDERAVRLAKIRVYEGDDTWMDYGA